MNFEAIFSSLGIFSLSLGQSIMLVVGLLILYLAISKKFEPLLLLPIGFGAIPGIIRCIEFGCTW